MFTFHSPCMNKRAYILTQLLEPIGLGIMSKARKVLKETTLQTLYNSLIYPYLSYCVELWELLVKLKYRHW